MRLLFIGAKRTRHILRKHLNCLDIWQIDHHTRKFLKILPKLIEQWIETAKELGRKIPEPKGRLIYA